MILLSKDEAVVRHSLTQKQNPRDSGSNAAALPAHRQAVFGLAHTLPSGFSQSDAVGKGGC